MKLKKEDNPLLLAHIRILRGFLISICAWPFEAFGERSHRKIFSTFLIMLLVIVVPGEINYLANKVNVLTFFDLGDTYMTLFLSTLTLVRATLPIMKNYGLIFKEFIMEFHLIHFKNKGEYYEKTCKKMIHLSHYFTLVMSAMMFSAVVFFNFACFYNNIVNWALINNKTENYSLQYSIYYMYPMFNQDNYFIFSTSLNIYFCYICSILVCGIDTIMFLMAFQIIGHIQILLNNIQNVNRPKHPIVIEVFCHATNTHAHDVFLEIYDYQENRLIRGILIEFIEHHKFIINFAVSVSKFFGPVLAFNYLYHLVGGAVLLLECLQAEPTELPRYLPVTVITFIQLIQTSVTFEVVGSESEKLKDAVYNMPWECMNVSNQRLVRTFLNHIQIPIRVTALGMTEVGVQTMAAILKTTFSYLTLLQSMNE